MRKILIIEDNIMNREILKEILCEEYEVLEAENGEAGLAYLEKHHQELSIILLDLQMPVMDGFTFMSHVKDDPILSVVPIIVMTADDDANTEERCMELGAVEFLEKPYNPVVMFGRIRNIIRMREAAADIMSVERDELTGLYTRQAFYHYAGKFLRENPDKEYTMLISDIREFRLLKSIYGEAAGDRILTAIADNLKEETTKHRGIAGYYGTDQFVALFESSDVPPVEELEECVSACAEIASVSHIRLKLGVYENIDRNLSVHQICDRVIIALELVKTSYERNVGSYDGPLAKRHRQEQQMETDFYDALEAGEFEAWFQPKYDPRDERIVGAEALVRWQRPDGVFNAPYLFIPLFEKDGLVAQLDVHMFRQVCDLQRTRMEQGKQLIPISVNLSRTTLYRGNVVDTYKRIIANAGVPMNMVPIEITESSAFLSDEISELIHCLKEEGFSLHMDDFGSGYSSLTSLGVLPFDCIKLDKGLTDTITTSRGELLTQHILTAIRELGMESVVEGVETKEQVEILQRIGCDAIQGYYYSKPVPQDVFKQMVEKNLER